MKHEERKIKALVFIENMESIKEDVKIAKDDVKKAKEEVAKTKK